MVATLVLSAALFADLTTAYVAPPASSTPITIDTRAAQVLRDINTKRMGFHRSDLVFDASLADVAAQHANDLARHHRFSHTSSDGKSPFDRMSKAAIPFGYAAENIALDESVPGAETALWNSPGHRENMLDAHYVHVGIAFAHEDDGSLIVVEDFTD